MRLTVNVTIDDMRNGRASNCELCPVALALSRALSEADIVFDTVEVYGATGFITGRNHVLSALETLKLPESVQEFVGTFDRLVTWRLGNLAPFSFEVEIEE